ncbi:MAG: long-chain fatty acid--CoA ligase [Candidatus Sumerlaeaceae bacterium]
MVPDTLKSRILLLLRSGAAVSDDEFTELALELHRAQRNASSFLERYYTRAAASNPRHWSEISGLPSSAFKRTAICTFAEATALTCFQTSGTTQGDSGRHYFETLEFYEAAIQENFRAHLLPDGKRMPMFILTPPPQDAPHSSLVHMMKVVSEKFGTGDSQYFLRDGSLEVEGLVERLQHTTGIGQPIFLLGTAFALVYFLDALAARKLRLEIPPGSRIMETGGFKGRSREIARESFYPMLSVAIGVPESHIVNEYGMTELSSQFYDLSLAQRIPTAHKSIPPYTRILCVDPATGQPVPDGVPGLLRIYDLANVGSCCVLQTEDVGIAHGASFEVHGRVPAAPIRGCSLAAEDALAGSKMSTHVTPL